MGGPIGEEVGWVWLWLCVSIWACWMDMGPKWFGVGWAWTLGCGSGMGPVERSEVLNTLPLSSMVAFMLRFSTDAFPVPEEQPLCSLRGKDS